MQSFSDIAGVHVLGVPEIMPNSACGIPYPSQSARSSKFAFGTAFDFSRRPPIKKHLKARKRCGKHLFLHGVELRRGIACPPTMGCGSELRLPLTTVIC